LENEKAGLAVMGFSYANIALKSKKDGVYIVYTLGKDAEKGKLEVERILVKLANSTVYLRVKVAMEAKCNFSYSIDGKTLQMLMKPSRLKLEDGKEAKLDCSVQEKTRQMIPAMASLIGSG
jgi:hypothetical protein